MVSAWKQREKKGLGLAQAKAYVEALSGGGNPDEAARSAPQGAGGCLPILVFLLIPPAALLWLFAR